MQSGAVLENLLHVYIKAYALSLNFKSELNIQYLLIL